MSHHVPVPAWQCHTMSHQATLTSTTPRPGNNGFIMSPYVTMSHHAPVPAWQCHTMSQSSHPDIDYPQTRTPRFYHVTNVTPCHSVTPCTCASLAVPHHVTSSHPDIDYPQTRKPRFYHVTNVTPCTCASLAVPHHVTSSHPDIDYPQTRKPRFYHVTNVTHVTMSHHAPVPAWQCHTLSHQATLRVGGSLYPRWLLAAMLGLPGHKSLNILLFIYPRWPPATILNLSISATDVTQFKIYHYLDPKGIKA